MGKAILRRDRDVSSVTALRDMLKDVIKDPAAYDQVKGLPEALSSQGKLAKYADSSRGIVAMSLNTQKLVAQQALGSFDIIDRLRRSAAEVLLRAQQKQQKPDKSSKEGLRSQVEQLKKAMEILDGDLGQLTNAFGRVVAYAHSLVRDIGTPEASVRWRKELRSVEAGLSLLSKPMGSNVVVGAFDAKK